MFGFIRLQKRALWVLAAACLGCATAKPENLGVLSGRLAPCPHSPNCVSTQSEEPSHAIEPIPYTGARNAAIERFAQIVRSMPRARVMAQSTDYVRAEFRSRLFGYVDDLEAYFDDSAKLVQLRSASRLGYFDLGVNRRRLEECRERFLAASPKGSPS